MNCPSERVDRSGMSRGYHRNSAVNGISHRLRVLLAAKLESGELHVFDCSTFTVDGQPVTSYMADVDTDPDYTPDTEAIVDGYFAESTFRSAPYFQLQIDGITLLDQAF